MKSLVQILKSSTMHWVGNGFPVRSVFSYDQHGTELSPFLLLDYAAPRAFSPGTEMRGVEAHPHKGFETVTVAYQGELEHRDSTGGGGTIGPGDVQWMTAGKGIIHEEFHSQKFTRAGGTLEMVQLWVNLRAQDKTADPHYQTLLNATIPVVNLPDDAGRVRIVAGEFKGTTGPARTFTPINVWDAELRFGKSADFPLPAGHTSAVLVLKGEVTTGDGKTANEGDLAIFQRSESGITLTGHSEAKLLILTGEPIEEPIAGHGPFVMNSQKEIQEAFEEFRSGKMGNL